MGVDVDAPPTAETAEDPGARVAADSKAPLADHFPPGTRIGRFVIAGLLGQGGMGVVYAAHDPVLERRVAIKVWRPAGTNAEATVLARTRLLREAQALAQFAHPNIVAVHDFGVHEDGVFLAMELVEGRTLRAWSKERARSPFEIMDVLRAAGAGLAAAHRAGIAHRDFKPDNVIVATDGGVRVVDFGLARSLIRVPDDAAPASEGAPVPGILSHESPSSSRSLSATLTLQGTVVGTPRYMAPELHLGLEADVLADQFSFCVTAFECLYGTPPFEPQKPGEPRSYELREVIRKGVPGRWRKAIARGLSPQKSRRFPSMDELLRELAYDPRVTRNRVLLGVAAALLVALPTTAWLRAARAPASPACAGLGEPATAIWSDSARAGVASAFVASGAPHAGDLSRRFDEVLDDYARRWAAARTAACQDTRIRGVLSEQVLDLRSRCLDGRLDQLRALVSIYVAGPDQAAVAHALEAAHRLGRPESCSDVAALTAPVPPPDDPSVRARVDALDRQLREAQTMATVGRHHDALVATRPLVELARQVGYPPVLGRALLQVGRLEAVNGDASAGEAHLREALDVAGGVVDDALFVDVLAELIYEVGYDDARYDEALRMGSVVLPFLERRTVDDESRALALSHLGVVRWANGQGAEAERLFVRALAIREKLMGKDDPLLSPDLDNLGNVTADAHRPAEARAYYERSLAVVRKAYGEDHPDVGRSLLNLATILGDQGDPAGAIADDQRALAIFEAQYGSSHQLVAAAANNLGEELVKVGRYDEALAACRKALAAGDATLEPDHPVRAYHQLCMARANLGLKRYIEARGYIERAGTLRAKSADPKERAEVKMLMGEALWNLPGERGRARQLLDEARAVYAAGEGDAGALAEIDGWLARR